MIKIRDKSLQLQAILDNAIDSTVNEEINREFTLSFKAIIDGDKSQYIDYLHIAEVDNNYFNIMYTKENHSSDSTLIIEAECEHVSYELNDYPHDYFTVYGTPKEILTELFQGTNFTVGQVEYTDPITFSVNEQCNKRYLLMTIADQLGGELKFDKYQISLYHKRGADRGVTFHYRKNLLSTIRVTDARSKVNGFPTITYETDVVELEFANGYGPDEHYELGDIIHVFDPELGINNLPLRIIQESHNPIQRQQSKVTVSNIAGAFIKDIYDTIIGIQLKAVMKEKVYNGCHIGPENGFEAIRSDNLAKSVMNATEGISVKKGDGSGSTWENVFFVDTEGNVVVKGKITGSEIEGSNITGGKIEGTEIVGSDITGGTINVTTDLFVGNNIHLGNTSSLDQTKIIYFNDYMNVEAKKNNTEWVIKLNCGVLELPPVIRGTVYFEGAVIFGGQVNGLVTDTSGYHNHGIPPNTRLATCDADGNIIGSVLWSPSGSHSHGVIHG